MTTTDRMDATDAQFADELARLDRLDVADIAADVAEAAALEAVRDMPADWYCPGDLHTQRINCPSCIAEVAARVAIDALKPAPGTDTSTEDALHRVLDLADELDVSFTGSSIPGLIRAAVAGPQRDHDEEGGQ